MDSNNCSNDSDFKREYIRQLEKMSNTAMIPAVVMMVAFSVVGLAGNILVLVVYSKKMRLSPTKVLIMTIATFDLVANVGAIPSEINIMMDAWTFSQPGVCKSKVFLGSFTTLGGAISLCVVAAIRYRKVCRPYGWQFTIRHSVIASILVACASFLFTIPYIIIYGVRTRITPCPNITGLECFASDYYFYTIWPLLNNMLFVLIYLSMAVSMVVIYTLIGKMAWKHSKLHGVSGAVTVTTNNTHSSSEGLSSSDNQLNEALEKETSPQPTNWPTRIKSEIVRRASSQILDCCRCKREDDKTEEGTSSSVNAKNNTATSDTDTGNKTSDSTLSDLDVTESEEPAGSRPVAGNGPDLVELAGVELSGQGESAEDFYRIQLARSSSVNRAQSYYIALSEENQHSKKEQDVAKKNAYEVNKTTSKSAPSTKTGENRRRLGRMTAMLIIISAIFVLGFLPFLTLTIVKNKFPEWYARLNMVELIFFNLFYRLYFLNSAINPIVYSLCDLNFRRECFRLLTCKSRKNM